jgi:hypothetical protein
MMQNVNRKSLVTPFLWAIGAATTEQVASPHLCTPAQLRLKHPLSLWGFSWHWSSANTIVLLRYSKTVLLIKHCPIQTFAEWRHSSKYYMKANGQLYAPAAKWPIKQFQVSTEWEVKWTPEPGWTLWRREKALAIGRSSIMIPGFSSP